MKESVKVFKALGDETRLRIVYLLVNLGALAVKDMEWILQISQTNVSRHLNILKNADVVFGKRQGNYVVYSLSSKFSEHLKKEIEKIGSASIQLQADLRRASAYNQKVKED